MSESSNATLGEQDARRVLTVFEVNQHARRILELHGGEAWVEGEIGEIARPSSGHLYFVLTDGRAQVRCTMYRSGVAKLTFELAVGQRVHVRAHLTVYEQRGAFQLHVREIVEAGEGARAAELERLRKKLAAEGLFDPARKRMLPRYPRTIGVVTSRDGAALRDIVKVAFERFPARLVLAHAAVQGPEAPEQIAVALERLQRALRNLDVVIVARGGGASEDLAAFNDERVVRAIAACRVPVVAGIGHEIDVTLADLCADVRAATPSNAAELAVPSLAATHGELERHLVALERAMDQHVDGLRMRLERMRRSLDDPRRRLREERTRIDAYERAIRRALGRGLTAARARLRALRESIDRHEPRARLGRDRAHLSELQARLPAVIAKLAVERRHRLARVEPTLASLVRDALSLARARHGELSRRLLVATRTVVEHRRNALAGHARALEALSPLSVLERGYAIATNVETGKALLDAREAPRGTRIALRLARGALLTEVLSPLPGDDPSSPAD